MILEKLFNLPSFGKRGLENMKALSKALKHPEKAFSSVHIAGTNGKGTVAMHVAEGLQNSGKRVGLFTSPHLFSFCERIRINGEMISEDEVEKGLIKLFALAEALGIQPTPFELMALLAFEYFRAQGVEWAVIETGLGGRLDATNIIEPELCIITSISQDHTDMLGTSIDEIASEKAGIIKKGVPVVVGKTAALEAVLSRVDSVLHVEKDDYLQIAKRALKHLGIERYDGTLQIPCRMEKRLIHGYPVIFDVAHNQAALQYLLDQFDEKPSLVFGFSKSAELDGILSLLQGRVTTLYLPRIQNPRLLDASYLQERCKKKGIDAIPFEVMNFDKLIAGMKKPLAVTGSFYLMQYFKPVLCDVDIPPKKSFSPGSPA